MAIVELGMILIGAAAFAGTGNGCSRVTKPADAALHRIVGSLLRTHAKTLRDWEGRPATMSGPLSCRDALLADFDGDGTEDIVALYAMSGRTDQALLVSAFQSRNRWRASVVEVVPASDRLTLLLPGEYRRSSQIARELRPAERTAITSHLPGAAVAAGAGPCLAFFLRGDRWVFTETACP